MKNNNIKIYCDEWRVSELENRRSLRLKGQCYLDEKALDSNSLAVHLDKNESLDDLMFVLAQLNGFYAWVEESDGCVRAAVDHIRSRPLFYACVDDCFYLSDDADWLRIQVKDYEMEPIACEEFQAAGYVTSKNTLFRHVKQLQAGECLVANEVNGHIQVETYQYYLFLHFEPLKYNESILLKELYQVTDKSIQTLIDYANGRQIVIPLSGGYDSRLIATMLKRSNYKNILTFTYGQKGNKESKYSKQVADSLKLDWIFVDYNKTMWREFWSNKMRWEYQRWASGGASLGHIQDFLAVKYLKENRMIDLSCIFVPGHTGDFVSGGHIPAVVYNKNIFSQNELITEIIDKNYNLTSGLFEKKGIIGKILATFSGDLLRLDGLNSVEFANMYELWEWRERQAKYICNSVRVYEFFGLDWWMPLWDKRFIGFFSNVPLQLRKRSLWYRFFVSRVYKNTLVSDSVCYKNVDALSIRLYRFRRVIEAFKVKELFDFLNNKKRIKKGVPLDEQCHYLLSGVNKSKIIDFEEKKYSVLGAYAAVNLEEFKGSGDDDVRGIG